MTTQHRIIIGDSRAMPELADRSVHLVTTSPPYWQLKDYGGTDQLGFHDSYEEYINNLNLVWSECYRVLEPGCRLCINIGDQFARSVYYGRYKVIPIRTEVIRFCETIGFDYMGAVIWQKVTTTNTSGGGSVMGSYPYPRNGILKLDYEFILLFKKLGKNRPATAGAKAASKMTHQEWNTFFSGHWNFPGERQTGHLAMFPEELPRRLIKMFSFVGETVLDPFVGSGTTSLAARNLGRNSVGFEINGEYAPLIQEKIGSAQTGLFRDATLHMEHREKPVADWDARRAALPYRFRDPVRIDKKMDPRTLRFGSKIERDDAEGPELLRVAAVLSPTVLELNTGARVRLLGVAVPDENVVAAVEYLRDATQGTRVFMRHDEDKHDSDGNLLCYLYLENKTFLNAHLIKRRLATVDSSRQFRFKDRFVRYEQEVSVG